MKSAFGIDHGEISKRTTYYVSQGTADRAAVATSAVAGAASGAAGYALGKKKKKKISKVFKMPKFGGAKKAGMELPPMPSFLSSSKPSTMAAKPADPQAGVRSLARREKEVKTQRAGDKKRLGESKKAAGIMAHHQNFGTRSGSGASQLNRRGNFR